MPFRAHQQANGKRGGQAAYQLLRIHTAIRRLAGQRRKQRSCVWGAITAICS
jgi:hypothetical protein